MAGSKNEVFWGSYSDTYDSIIDSVIGRESRRLVFEEISRQQNLGNVIEFGCGPGYFTRAVARNATNVLATDLSDNMLDKARSNLSGLQNVDYAKTNCEHTPFPDNHFDTVLMANVLLILEHPVLAVKEAHRILKPGGRLILSNYTNYGLSIYDKFVFAIRFFSRMGMPPYRRMLPPDEIRSIVQGSGLQIEELKLVGANVKAIYLIARK